MLTLLVEVVGEFLLQLLIEALIEAGFHSLGEPFRRTPNPWLAALGFTLFGAALGGLSLFFFPAHLTPAGLPRLLNLLLTPVAVGLCMAWLGRQRERNGQTRLRIDRFWFGALFAFALGLVRYQFAA